MTGGTTRRAWVNEVLVRCWVDDERRDVSAGVVKYGVGGGVTNDGEGEGDGEASLKAFRRDGP